METWLHSGFPVGAIKLMGRYILRADRAADHSDKARTGQLCIYVKKV